MPKLFPIIAFGIKYPSLSAAARAFGMSPKTFKHYILDHYVEPEALLACSDSLVRLSFIGPDGRAYYIIPSAIGLFTARDIVLIYRPDLLAAYDASNPTGRYKPYSKP